MTESYWYLRATQAEQQLDRVRARLGWRGKGKNLDHAIDELLTDYARTAAELSAFLRAASPALPVDPLGVAAQPGLDDSWTAGT